jgi:hypothetical protein
MVLHPNVQILYTSIPQALPFLHRLEPEFPIRWFLQLIQHSCHLVRTAMEFSQMDCGVERSPALQSSRLVSVEVLNRGGDKEIIGTVSVEVVGQERNDDVCKRVAIVESSSVGAELGSNLETNYVDLGGEKIVGSDVKVGATLEKDVLGAGRASLLWSRCTR